MEDQSPKDIVPLSFSARIELLREKYKGDPEMLQEVERTAKVLADQRLAMTKANNARKKKRKRKKQSRRANR